MTYPERHPVPAFPDIEDTTERDAIFAVPRRFYLERLEDHTGISGTGVVVTGVQFPDGKVVLQWAGVNSSIAVWDNVDMVVAIHGHDGATVLRWID